HVKYAHLTVFVSPVHDGNTALTALGGPRRGAAIAPPRRIHTDASDTHTATLEPGQRIQRGAMFARHADNMAAAMELQHAFERQVDRLGGAGCPDDALWRRADQRGHGSCRRGHDSASMAPRLVRRGRIRALF